LTREYLEKFREAPKKDYYKLSEKTMQILFLYKHLHLEILYITVRTDPIFIDITKDKEIEVVFTYSVKWVETQTPFKQQMDNYFKVLILASVFGNPFGSPL
jgi:hypothetical protein